MELFAQSSSCIALLLILSSHHIQLGNNNLCSIGTPSVGSLCSICIPSVNSLCSICIPSVNSLCSTGVPLVTYGLQVYILSVACVLLVSYLLLACLPQVYHQLVACVLQIYYQAVEQFNQKPKQGIAYLREQGYLDGSNEDIIKFLKETPRLSKSLIGEYISRKDNPDLTKAYMRYVQERGSVHIGKGSMIHKQFVTTTGRDSFYSLSFSFQNRYLSLDGDGVCLRVSNMQNTLIEYQLNS